MLILPEFGVLVTNVTVHGMQEFDDETKGVLLPLVFYTIRLILLAIEGFVCAELNLEI